MTDKLLLLLPPLPLRLFPKQGSKVLFPGALPLASAGVGGYTDLVGESVDVPPFLAVCFLFSFSQILLDSRHSRLTVPECKHRRCSFFETWALASECCSSCPQGAADSLDYIYIVPRSD